MRGGGGKSTCLGGEEGTEGMERRAAQAELFE